MSSGSIGPELKANIQAVKNGELTEATDELLSLFDGQVFSRAEREERALIDHGRKELPPFADLADHLASSVTIRTGDYESAEVMLNGINLFIASLAMALDKAEIDCLQPPEL